MGMKRNFIRASIPEGAPSSQLAFNGADVKATLKARHHTTTVE
jgi:hypothetical protein